MIISFEQCAKVTGKSVSTIYRAIRKGLISSSLTDDGKKGVEVSELGRVFPLLNSPDEKNAKQNDKSKLSVTGHAKDFEQDDKSKLSSFEADFLQKKIQLLEESLADTRGLLKEARAEREEARTERAKLFTMMEQMQLKMLPAPIEDNQEKVVRDTEIFDKKPKKKKRGKKKKE